MYQKILVPIDGSEVSLRGLAEAIKLAKNQRGQLRLLHVVNEMVLDTGFATGVYAGSLIESIRDAGTKLMHEAEALVRQNGLDPEAVMLEVIGGPASELIIAQAKKWPADLIVMGTHGRRGLRRLAMGSDAENVVRDSPVPVLLVHAAARTAVADSKVQAPRLIAGSGYSAPA
jgi:nucleotide-binding universal stress UspA family protein